MITRAQAEALLTLAESLEACERQGIRVDPVAGLSVQIPATDRSTWVNSAMGLRVFVSDNIPKHTGS